MKQKKSMLAALLLTAVVLTGCGEKITSDDTADSASAVTAEQEETKGIEPDDRDDTGADEEIQVLADGTEVISYPDGTMIIHTDAGFEWVYLGGTCRMFFPPEWDDRFTVHGTSVYSKKCYDAKEGDGELFSLQFINESAFVKDTKPAALLGMVRKMYAVAVIPEEAKYDASNEELDAEYQDMRAALSGVFQTAVCEGRNDFTPVDLSGYVPSTESEDSTLFGSWETTDVLSQNPADAVQMAPFVTFRSRDSAVGYHYTLNGVSFGAFLVSQDAENDAGLAFLDGRVFRLIHTEGQPRTLTFELILMAKESTDTLDGQSFYYERDWEQIYQSDADDTELEF